MSIYTFTNPVTGQKFDVETPATFTEAQARQIFEQQLNAGSLVGLKPGDLINSVSQLAGGLRTAASQVTQAISGVAGSANGVLTGTLDKAKQAASALPSKDLLAATQSVATKTVAKISAAANNLVPTNPINLANLAQQAAGLVSIKGLSQVDVRAAMSQAAKIVGQTADQLTNDKGLGQFGFDVQQLERAGVIKPGTFSTYLANGTANLTAVLNSPAVWTGVNGITSVDKLLASPSTQNLIQQNLMSQGIGAVNNLGIPVNNLSPQSLAGTALNSAKSIEDTMTWAKGLQLPASVKASFDQVSRDAAFAVDFVKSAANDAIRQQEPADPSTDTADRSTIDAASDRITGDDKIPDVDYSGTPPLITVAQFQQALTDIETGISALLNDVSEIGRKVATGTQGSRDPVRLVDAVQGLVAVEGEFEVLDSELLSLTREANIIEKNTGSPPPDLALIDQLRAKIDSILAQIEQTVQRKQQDLESL